MPTQLARMTAAELVDDQDDEETRPDAPTPILTADISLRELRIEWLMQQIGDTTGTLWDALRRELKKLSAEFRSWHRCKPTAEVKRGVEAKFQLLDKQVVCALSGTRDRIINPVEPDSGVRLKRSDS